MHSFAKVPRIEKSPSEGPSSPVTENRRVPEEEEHSVSIEKSVERSPVSMEKSKSSSEPPVSASTRYFPFENLFKFRL